jgi:hypothetical protein
MSALEQMESVFTVGLSTFRIRLGAGSSDRRVKVTITMDDRMEWTYDHASWRPLAFGFGSGIAYVWSARGIIVLPDGPGADPDVLDVDEDLLLVFRTEAGWLLVCETSVRLIIDQEEASRVEVGDVIERARWNGCQLLIEDARGMTTPIDATGGRLTC